ncbi:MAG: FecR domain-containing protein [Gammaproteobacteria bacterium]
MSRQSPHANHQILEEASTWFVAFRSQELDESARREFQQWLKRSPEHIRAYLEIASTYADIPAPEGGRTPPELIARARSSPDINVVPFDSRAARIEISPPAPPGAFDSLPRKRGLIATRIVAMAAVLMLVLIGAWFFSERNTYRTSIGEQRSITLPDGSIVELNARSKVRVQFREDERGIELLSGQALFRVAKDKTRPFVVRSDHAQVRAVGTQFDVYRKSGGTLVTVLEGRVAVVSGPAASRQADETAKEWNTRQHTTRDAQKTVQRADGSSDTPERGVSSAGTGFSEMLLAAGEQMTVTATRAQRSERPNIAAATAWTQHQLIFDGTPLDEVIEEFSRYTSRRLIIDSDDLANLRISGQYTSTNPDSLLRFLSLQKGVVIVQMNGDTHIRKE